MKSPAGDRQAPFGYFDGGSGFQSWVEDGRGRHDGDGIWRRFRSAPFRYCTYHVFENKFEMFERLWKFQTYVNFPEQNS